MNGRILPHLSSPILLRTCLALLLSLLFSNSVTAQPATLQFHDCFDGNNSQKMSVQTVYAQIIDNQHLNITVLGETSQEVVSQSANSSDLTTLFIEATTLTFNTWNNATQLCASLVPPSPLPTLGVNVSNYCPIPAGPYGLSASIPFNIENALTTMNTELRAVDPFGNEILCLEVATTVLQPGPLGSPYGRAHIIFWATVGLAIVYFLLVGIARVVSAWGRGSTRSGVGIGQRLESAGFILASAISGERLAASPALLRFCSPSLRDIFFHTQWCAALSMVAVQWPPFIYPLLSQTAWASLTYNITFTQVDGATDHWNPLTTQPYNPPSDFADQLNDTSSAIYVDSSLPNTLFLLPPNTPNGIESYAYSVGLRPQDLFGICMGLFLAIIGATIVFSCMVWMIEWLVVSRLARSSGSSPAVKLGGSRSPRFSSGSKDLLDAALAASADENRSFSGHYMFRAAPRLPLARKFWWRLRLDITSLHFNIMLGNLTRILVWFHLPVTIFSSYQLARGADHDASISSVVLAALSFAMFSVLLPLFLIFRLASTSTNKLYDETRTLLSIGPLYNHYRHGSQLFASLLFVTNLVIGITIGCGQKSGTAQAIIILVLEVISALITSVWLPWGQGASMGLISFLFCVARIVVAVLLVILTPTINIGTGAGGWVAYGILFVLCLVYFAFFLMLVVKIIEAAVRIFGHIGFDQGRRVVDSGLLGACGLLGCCGSRNKRRKAEYRKNDANGGTVSSGYSSYSPPIANFTRKETSSHHSNHSHHSKPTSVLRPEHALRPYREDSDDETGYIMGAWQPFPRAAYSAVDDAPSSPPIPPTKSGFSRVGGGRAHYDSPYAIATGSTHTFPSTEKGPASPTTKSLAHSQLQAHSHSPSAYEDNDVTPTASVANLARIPQAGSSSLPPGAMMPHVRTKSQTAIIENVSALMGGAFASASGESAVDDISFGAAQQPRRKHWYNLRRSRRYSEGGVLEQQDEEEEMSPSKGTGPSFVVIRDRKPQRTTSQTAQSRPVVASDEAGPSSPSKDRPKSFVVLRGSDANPLS